MLKKNQIKKMLLITSTSLVSLGIVVSAVACSQRSIDPVTYQLYKTKDQQLVEIVFKSDQKLSEKELANTSFDFQQTSPQLKTRASFKPTKVVLDSVNNQIKITFDLKLAFEPNQAFLVVPSKYFKSFQLLITELQIKAAKTI
ncbi:hypothetical protein [Ureaplasma diversum]|uniref:Lipoprotein n=1 Tax=Ureaplasma diversum NCTC 246 TaxID=1188241 RepID=A0A084F060_9BACT|nr:hypothetical protein [Ureaplasma diversum]KEZ23602.1 Hypothetical protein, predicted lipoprotein [Ureaplasma diversum NCTC 246]